MGLRIKGIITVILLVLTACTSKQPLKEKQVLVSTDWLQVHLDESSLIILHVGTEEVFDSLHIPHSQYVRARDFITTRGYLRNEIQDMDIMDSILESKGIHDQSHIVLIYEDESVIPLTARLFLTLNYAGLQDRTSVLNGGLTQWLAEDRTTTDTVFERPRGDLHLEVNKHIMTDAQGVKGYLEDPEYVILDSRPVTSYTGSYDSTEQRYTGGHIEGVRNLPFDSFLSETNPWLLKEDAELMREFEKRGVDAKKTVVHSCGSGFLTCVNYLVSEHLGYRSLFYDGSFQEWEKLELPVTRPVKPLPDHE